MAGLCMKTHTYFIDWGSPDDPGTRKYRIGMWLALVLSGILQIVVLFIGLSKAEEVGDGRHELDKFGPKAGMVVDEAFNKITLGKGHISGELSDAEDAKELLKSVPSADVIATNALLMGLMGVIVICGSLSCLLGHVNTGSAILVLWTIGQLLQTCIPWDGTFFAYDVSNLLIVHWSAPLGILITIVVIFVQLLFPLALAWRILLGFRTHAH